MGGQAVLSVLGPQQQDGTKMVIFMPPSATFSASTTLGDRQHYEIQELNNATCDSEGNVELASRQFLHQINLIPALAHYEFTLTEHKIVMAAIVFLQREGLLETSVPPFGGREVAARREAARLRSGR
jgi:hypothetical protein